MPGSISARNRGKRLSPPQLYGDFTGLPRLLIQAGESEMLLDDARNVHAKALAAGVLERATDF